MPDRASRGPCTGRPQGGRTTVARALLASGALIGAPSLAQPQSPWPAGDEISMANTLGPATWRCCAPHLSNPRAKSYELSYVRSNTMPQSPFAPPLRENAKPTAGVPMTRHPFNTDEVVSGDPGQQGTRMDALGHFVEQHAVVTIGGTFSMPRSGCRAP